MTPHYVGGGGAPLLFLSPEGLFHKKNLIPHTIRGQQGDKREKVKKLKYLFTISYIPSLFPASENSLPAPISSEIRPLFEDETGLMTISSSKHGISEDEMC